MERPRPDPELLRECTRVSRWRSPALCVAIHAAVFALAWLGSRELWFAPIAVILIVGLQHHLLILVHESAHVLVHPSRVVNDLVGNVFCAIPCLTLVRNYRIFHLVHHRFSGSPTRDPEVPTFAAQGYAYRRRGALGVVALLAADTLGVNVVRLGRYSKQMGRDFQARKLYDGVAAGDAALALAIWGTALGASIALGVWKELLVFWVLPQPFLLFLLLKLHGYGEHTGATGPTELERTWNHDFGPVARFFLYPLGSGFHLEHHLFPRVPWYRMKRLRRALREDPEYRRRAEAATLDGYFFGRRTVLRTMLLGSGESRLDQAAETAELAGAIVADETRDEVERQLAAGALGP